MKQATEDMEHASLCKAAHICPFKTLCALFVDAAASPLEPQAQTVNKGEVLAVNPGHDQLVYIFKSGFFSIYGEAEPGVEVPFAIYGEGVVAGMVELYTTKKVSDTYNISCLLPGEVCVLHSQAIRSKLATLPYEYAQRIVCSGLMNQFSAVFSLMRIRGRTYIYDQIVALLNYFIEFSSLDDTHSIALEITQEEIANIIGANRMAVSRVLRKLQEDGLLEHSYKSILVDTQALPQPLYAFSNDFISPQDDAELYALFLASQHIEI